MDYEIVKKGTTLELEVAVRDHLIAGWDLAGGIQVTVMDDVKVYLQAMVKYD